MKAWLMAPQEDTTRPGALVIRPEGDIERITAFQKLIDLLPHLKDTTQVWQVDLTDNVKSGDWSVIADKVDHLEKYDIMSVILDVSPMIMDDILALSDYTNEKAKIFMIRAEAVHDCMSSVDNLLAVINNTVSGFSHEMGQEAGENKKDKYNDWLESALKASTPNSLVADKPLTTTYKSEM